MRESSHITNSPSPPPPTDLRICFPVFPFSSLVKTWGKELTPAGAQVRLTSRMTESGNSVNLPDGWLRLNRIS
jgi:hypothetical protein